jgi:PEP-CTERM motif
LGPIGGSFTQTVYFSGDLNLDVRPFKLKNVGRPHLVDISGTLMGCADPDCNVPLFPLSIDLVGNASLNFRVNPSGEVTFISALFVVPEPGSMALVATGCVFVFRRYRQRRKQ